MPTPSSGHIELSDLATEWGDLQPNKLSEFYRDGDYVSNDGVPTTGHIKLSQFYGLSASSTGTLVASVANVNEGSSVTFTLPTSGYQNGVTFPYTITGIQAADLNPQTLTGNMTVSNNNATVTITTRADATTEGAQTMTFTCDEQSVNVLINDTSKAPTYTLSRSASQVNEGQSVTFTLITTNVAQGTTIAWSLSGVTSADIGGASTTGNFTIASNGRATKTFTLANDLTTEGTETMTMYCHSISRNASVSIIDTSIAPLVNFAASPVTIGSTLGGVVNSTANSGYYYHGSNISLGSGNYSSVSGVGAVRMVLGAISWQSSNTTGIDISYFRNGTGGTNWGVYQRTSQNLYTGTAFVWITLPNLGTTSIRPYCVFNKTGASRLYMTFYHIQNNAGINTNSHIKFYQTYAYDASPSFSTNRQGYGDMTFCTVADPTMRAYNDPGILRRGFNSPNSNSYNPNGQNRVQWNVNRQVSDGSTIHAYNQNTSTGSSENGFHFYGNGNTTKLMLGCHIDKS